MKALAECLCKYVTQYCSHSQGNTGIHSFTWPFTLHYVKYPLPFPHAQSTTKTRPGVMCIVQTTIHEWSIRASLLTMVKSLEFTPTSLLQCFSRLGKAIDGNHWWPSSLVILYIQMVEPQIAIFPPSLHSSVCCTYCMMDGRMTSYSCIHHQWNTCSFNNSEYCHKLYKRDLALSCWKVSSLQ